METKNNTKPWIYSSLGLLFLCVPVALFGLWIYVFEIYAAASQSEMLDKYNAYLPGFMHNRLMLSVVVFTFSILSILFTAKSLASSSSILRVINIFFIIVASVVIMLQLFSVM